MYQQNMQVIVVNCNNNDGKPGIDGYKPLPPSLQEVWQNFQHMFGKISLKYDNYTTFVKERDDIDSSGIKLSTYKFKTNLTKIDTGRPPIYI